MSLPMIEVFRAYDPVTRWTGEPHLKRKLAVREAQLLGPELIVVRQRMRRAPPVVIPKPVKPALVPISS